jgi:hypothetical protein
LKANNNSRVSYSILAVCLLLSACATGKFLETSTPVLDKNFGESLKAGKQAQKIAKDPNQADVVTVPTSKELALPFDNYMKGKGAASPVLERPVSSSGGN